MNGLMDFDSSEFVEVDPTGRYGRYNEILGKGASKIVYRAFDEYEGIEVAWNQVKLYDFLQSPEDLERLYCEIHLLKTLKHKNIMKFYCSWVDTANRNINFVTEMFTSGTLRQYRLKHKRVNIRAVKHWCRQILRGLLYLHSHDPPVIHRDLKCDNIFVNGNQGEVKIGDLGLAAILRKSHAAHCVGTPEFMAPEVYEEAYNELVDIYSFGMCILEMVTFEYPYSECNHPAQIYKKVVSGKKPDSLYEVKDPEVRQFIVKCLASVSHRLSARELLDDGFLRLDDHSSDSKELDYGGVYERVGSLIRQPYVDYKDNTCSSSNGYSNGYDYERHNELDYHLLDVEPCGIELFEHHDDELSPNVDISIKGKIKDDGSIFIRLRIADKEGRIRNIYFPFDIENDTALSVATEMVAELDIMDQDVTKIADMIDGEMASLVPGWRPGPGIVETPRGANLSLCHNCASTCTSAGSLMEFLSNNPCCLHGCASMHGRFEEITFQADQTENHLTEVAPDITGESDHGHYDEIWGQHESRELTPEGSGRSHSDEEYEKFDMSASEQDKKEIKIENGVASIERNPVQHFPDSSYLGLPPLLGGILHKQEDKVQQKLRWLKAKYRMELRMLQDQHIGVTAESSTSSGIRAHGVTNWVLSPSQRSLLLQEADDERLVRPSASGRRRIPGLHVHVNKNCCPDSDIQSVRRCEVKNYYTGSLFPNSIHRRTASLPVDAVDL